MDNKSIDLILTKVRNLLLKADYKAALALITPLRKKTPGNFKIDYTYAKILGDYADELPLAERKKLKNESIIILAKLLGRMNGQSEDVRFGVRINFYYQTRRFRDLEKVGLKMSKTNKINGSYASGLGASLEAESLATKKAVAFRRKAIRIAGRSLKHWDTYFKLCPKETYYFPYSLQAMSFAVLSRAAEMEKALSKAAKLSKRKATYWEFEEVRKLAAICKPD